MTMTPLDPMNKSGHYVAAEGGGKCWCGDVHFYSPPGCACGNRGACASVLCAPKVTC